MLFTLIVPIEVIYAKESLGTTSAGYGVLLASWGAGIFIGSLLYLRVKNRSPWALVVASTLAIAVAYLGLAVAGSLLVACLISVVGGIGNGIQWIAVMTALQEQTARDFQARITGLMESLGAAMPGVGLPARRRDRRPQLTPGRLRDRRRRPAGPAPRRPPPPRSPAPQRCRSGSAARRDAPGLIRHSAHGRGRRRPRPRLNAGMDP